MRKWVVRPGGSSAYDPRSRADGLFDDCNKFGDLDVCISIKIA